VEAEALNTGTERAKITLIHRYFWPENTPYAQMLRKIAMGLVASYEVSVLTTQPSHTWDNHHKKFPGFEISDGIKIKRQTLLPEFGRKILLRAINTLLFAIWIFIKLLFRKTDFVMVATTPPVLIATVVRWVSRIKGFRYIYHCQDIHPEALNLIGALKKGILYNVLQKMDLKNICSASAVVVLSEDMKGTLIKRGVSGGNIHIINNFIFETKRDDAFFIEPQNTDFTILFAGNLGRFQNLDKVIEAAKLLKDNEEIKFIFLGDGVERKKLETAAGGLLNKTVNFLGHVPVSKVLRYMEHADIGLISIASGVTQVAYPSKTMMYLAAGLPLLVMVESDSNLAKFIEENHLGYVCGKHSPNALAETIKTAFHHKEALRGDRKRIADLAERVFGEEVVVRQWIDLFQQLKTQ